MPSTLFLLLSSLCVLISPTVTERPSLIKLNSSLSLNLDGDSQWYSRSGRFAFGFYSLGRRRGYAVGIVVLRQYPHTDAVVWTLNRDDHPHLTANATLQLTLNGHLLLRTEHGQEKNNLLLATPTAVSSASMLDSGNFVLYDNKSRVVWQSFDFPTDTILGGQTLPSGGRLVSSLSDTDQSSGRFLLNMQNDGNLVLYSANSATYTEHDAYWSSNTYGYGFNFHLYLRNKGSLLIVNTTNHETITALSNISVPLTDVVYRATLDSDGIFRLYAEGSDYSGIYHVSILWSALDNACSVKGFCEFNSYCTISDHQARCNSIPGSDFVDRNQATLGCRRNSSDSEYCGSNATSYDEKMVFLTSSDKLTWEIRNYSDVEMTEDQCRNSCLQDCLCGVAIYDGRCKKQVLPLRYVKVVDEDDDVFFNSTAFFKVGTRIPKSSNLDKEPSKPEPLYQPPPIKKTSKKAIVQIVALVLCFAFLFCATLAVSSHLVYKTQALRYQRLLEIGDLGLNEGVTMRVFSYNELHKATDGFNSKHKLGKGSFGTVYRGSINKGRRLIAVKRLEKLVEDGEREFQAEMRAIGKTHHRNLVRLLGYCAEGSKRLLVYEYMSNGSLGDLLFGNTRRPDWDERRKIALDIARGILYLHEECEAPIIHCDIKPQNILMDEFWTAKISDFGLAKLLMPDQTRTFTEVRGTRGYLAPEWQKNTPITVKADVYSYGVMLLEILFCRRNIIVNVSEPEQIVLSNWVYKCFDARELKKLVPGEEVEYMLLENMVKVGLWCIQDEPFLRPSMKSVVLMLEGITDVSVPPCPSANSM